MGFYFKKMEKDSKKVLFDIYYIKKCFFKIKMDF